MVDRPASCLDELHYSSRDAAEAEGVAGVKGLPVEAEDGHRAFGVVIHGPRMWEEVAGGEVAGGSDTGSRVQIPVAPGMSLIAPGGEAVEMGNSLMVHSVRDMEEWQLAMVASYSPSNIHTVEGRAVLELESPGSVVTAAVKKACTDLIA